MRKSFFILSVLSIVIFLYGIYNISLYHYAFDTEAIVGTHLEFENSMVKVTDIWLKDNILMFTYTPLNRDNQYGYAVFSKNALVDRYKLKFYFENDGSENYDVVEASGVQYIFKFQDGQYKRVNTMKKKEDFSIFVVIFIAILIVIIRLVSKNNR